MRFISHRGNIKGRNPERENSPTYIKEAISMGFDVEVDIWWWRNGLWLGHDEPVWGLPETFLDEIKDNAWLHCKNLEMVQRLINTDYHWFWHESDKVCLTSHGHVWCHPNHEVSGGIINDIGQSFDLTSAGGICSDSISTWRNYD